MLKSSFTFKLFLIQIAFDFSKYDLMLQIQQITIFCFLQSIKCFENLLCKGLRVFLIFFFKYFY